MTKREFDHQPVDVLRLGRSTTAAMLREGHRTIGQLYLFWKNSGDFVSEHITPAQSRRIARKFAAYQRQHPECFGWQDEVWI